MNEELINIQKLLNSTDVEMVHLGFRLLKETDFYKKAINTPFLRIINEYCKIRYPNPKLIKDDELLWEELLNTFLEGNLIFENTCIFF